MTAQPHGQFWRTAAGVVIMLTAGAGLARAQVHNDFTSMNSTFSSGAASTVLISPGQMGITGNSMFVGTLPNLDSSVNDSRASLPGNTFQKSISALAGQTAGAQWKSNFPLGPNLDHKMAPTSPTRQPQMLEDMQQKSSLLSDFTSRDKLDQHEVGPAKFTDSYTFHAVDNGTQLEQASKELSLQDINRYQFQGSFSGAPGLPVTHAGGNTDAASVAGASLTSLTSGQTLFDDGSVSASHPRSGGSVAPNFITTGGTMPYNPTRGTSFSTNAPIGGSGGGGQSAEASSDGFTVPLQHSAQTQTSTQPQNFMPTGGLIPSGSYAPTAPDGKEIPIQVDNGDVIVRGATLAPP